MKYAQEFAKFLKEDDAFGFQKILSRKLNKNLKEAKRLIMESVIASPESKAISEITSAAKSYGASNISSDAGLITMYVEHKSALKNLLDYLDENDSVDSYDCNAIAAPDAVVDVPVLGLELNSISESDDYIYEIEVTLVPGIVSEAKKVEDTKEDESDDEEDDEDESDDEEDDDDDKNCNESTELNELAKQLAVRGGKKIKVWVDPGENKKIVNGKLVTMTGAERQARRMGAIHAAKLRRAKMPQINKKRAKSDAKRAALGLNQ